MNISGKQIFVFSPVAAVSFIAYIVKRCSSPPFLVQRWVKDNGFRILDVEFRPMSQGPFTWTSPHRGQEVYRVRLRDGESRERSCWLRCTEVGMVPEAKTEVVWDTTVSI